MTIEDQIKDEKLQYDINREAAKISALSSGKIDKYEYLTGEEILPSNQQQIIQQAKFTYSPLGNTFEKQTKTIEDQGKKQVKAIQNNKLSVNINNDGDYKDELLLSREKGIFKDIYNKRLDKIEELNNKIDYNNLNYVVVGTGDEYNFNNLDDPLTLLNNIEKGKISMEKAIEQQYNFHKYLNLIRIGNKNDNQKRTLANINIFYNARDNATQFIRDYGGMILEAKNQAIEEQFDKGLKILTPNQMLRRLPIALAQMKAGNNSESLLNEIKKIVYSLYRSKEITKKVYNNIVNSIKV